MLNNSLLFYPNFSVTSKLFRFISEVHFIFLLQISKYETKSDGNITDLLQ